LYFKETKNKFLSLLFLSTLSPNPLREQGNEEEEKKIDPSLNFVPPSL